MNPTDDLVERVQRLESRREARAGHTTAQTFVVRLANRDSIFVKRAVDAETAAWLRREYRIYETVQADFLPRLVGWDGNGLPVLAVEDVSGGRTAPPWTAQSIAQVRSVLEGLAATAMPNDFPSLENYPKRLKCWREIERSAPSFLQLGLVTEGWLKYALPMLIDAESRARLSGSALVHSDVRSDNICFHAERTVLVDWAWACRGNATFDLVSWLPSLHAEGGPQPWEILDDEPALVAMHAGYLAERVTCPGKQDPEIRTLQLAQLDSALPWATKLLGLPLPDGPKFPR